MSTNPRAARRKRAQADLPPALPTLPEARETELIGVDEDGNMSLWQVGNVRPVTAFETDGIWIKGGHYVIQWKGHAITVHCNGGVGGLISLQFMCSRNWVLYMRLAEVEAMLLGKVIPDPEHEARILLSLKEWGEALHRSQQVPHRRRGRI
jgi:hypothetical protein